MKPGVTSKDSAFTNNFNRKKKTALTPAEKMALKVQKRQIEAERKRKQKELDKIRHDLSVVQSQVSPGFVEETVEEDTTPEPTPEEDEKSAHKMLVDLRYAYRNSVGPTGKRGRSRLVELLNTDHEFKFAVKELVKVDAAIMAAKVRKEGDSPKGTSKNFFVVLKGLGDDKKFLAAGSSMIDMKSLGNSLNPSYKVYEQEKESKGGVPEQLHKKVEGE